MGRAEHVTGVIRGDASVVTPARSDGHDSGPVMSESVVTATVVGYDGGLTAWWCVHE